MKNIKLAIINFKTKNGLDSSAVLSFSTLFAIVPILTLAFSVFSLSPYFADLQQHLEKFLFGQVMPKNYELVSQYINQFIASAQKLNGISIVFLLLAAIFLFRGIELRINSMWEGKKKRHLGKDLLIYLLVLFLGPLFLAGSLFASSYFGASKAFVFVPMGALFIASLPIVLSAIGLSLLYYFIPSTKNSFKYALKAGFIVAFFLEILKSVMLIYITYFPMYELIYGALSMILLFMLWVYFSWALVLFGASLGYIYNEKNKVL